MKSGHLYVLVHPSDPDLYKVGVTILEPEKRLKDGMEVGRGGSGGSEESGCTSAAEAAPSSSAKARMDGQSIGRSRNYGHRSVP